MDYARYTKTIREMPDSNIYVLISSDDYLINLTSDAIFNRAKKSSSIGIERHRFYADTVSSKEALAPLENQGFFSSGAVVIIHNIDKYGGRDSDIIASYILHPVPSSVLIMTAETIDKRKSLYKQLQKANIPVIEFKATTEEELAGWIRAIASQKGKKISADAIEKLAIRVGGNLGIAAMEVKKLIAYIGLDEQIDAHHVEELVGHSRVDSAFDLSNAIAGRDASTALSIVKTLFEEGESEIGMVALLRWQFLRILRGKSLENESVPHERILSELGVRFYQKEFLAILKAFDYASALKAYLALFDADISLRGKILDKRFIIESLIISLCNA